MPIVARQLRAIRQFHIQDCHANMHRASAEKINGKQKKANENMEKL
jgi:hypothetical protein